MGLQSQIAACEFRSARLMVTLYRSLYLDRLDVTVDDVCVRIIPVAEI